MLNLPGLVQEGAQRRVRDGTGLARAKACGVGWGGGLGGGLFPREKSHIE